MPTMDGYEFVLQVRAIPAVAAPPVIFYTATYHEREARALAERCGVRDIITKPSDWYLDDAVKPSIARRRGGAAWT